MLEEFQPIIAALLMGAAYSLFWYLNKVADPTDPTKIPDLDPYPIIATMVVGACIGVYTVFMGGELSQVSLGIQLATYATLIAGIERLGKTIVRVMKDKGWWPI